jgi:polysaccharide export outer membrane protein
MKKVLLIILLAMFLLSPVSAVENKGNSDYRIGKNDVIEISVYNEPDLNKTLRVSPEGTINFPLLGNIKVIDLTAKELEANITDKLAGDYLVNPQVTVFIREFSKVSILGQVNKPGAYEFKSGTTVIHAIALAGGFSEGANPERVKLIREENGVKNTQIIDTFSITNEMYGDNDVLLLPGDVIVVDKIGTVSVVGQVRKPGSYDLKKESTVIDAIAFAGGLTELAAPNDTKVIRVENGRKMVFRIPVGSIMSGREQGKDIKLKADDTVIVPESFF